MKNVRVAALVMCALVAGVLPLLGATNYWDNNGDADGFGAAGGTWGVDGKWSADGTGASVPSVTDTTADDDLFFGTSSNGLSAGTVAVDGTNQAFRSITFGAASGPITVAGGTLNLAAPLSTVTVNNASNTIASVLAGSGGLRKEKSDSYLLYTNFMPAALGTIFTNAALSECVGVTAIMSGGFVTGGSTPSQPYHFVNSGTNLTVQLQAYNGGHTKCVKIELVQSGADIIGRAVYAKYLLNVSQLGYDFDTGGNLGTIATSATANGYGITQLNLIVPRVLRLGGTNTFSGDIDIVNGTLEIGGSGQLGAGAYAGAITNSGQLLYSSSVSQSLCGSVSGTGSLVMESEGKSPAPLKYALFLLPAPTVIFQNASLSDCVGADGRLGGASISGGSCDADAYYFSNQGTNVTYQLQATNDVYTKCVKVELIQSGPHIAARLIYAKYVSGDQRGFDFDAGGNTFSIATTYAEAGYGVPETVISLNQYSKLTLAATNTYTGGTSVNRGTLEASATAYALPSAGAITVNSGGELMLKVSGMSVGNAGGVGNGNPISVNAGGVLTLATNFNAGFSRLITLDGGTLNSTFLENNDSANYVNNLSLLNGARVTGYKLRMGYNSSAVVAVSGASASSIEAGLNLVKNSSYTLTFNVADASGDAASDLTIPGVIRDYDTAGFAGLPIIKAGAGTLCFSGANTHTGPITVTAGTFSLGTNGTLNSGNPITLSGGTLDMGAYTNTVGALTVSTNSAIALGPGQLAFADSSGTEWTHTLTLSGELDAHTLRFGTNGVALTPGQLSAIKLNGKNVRLRSDGYLAPALTGTVVLIQ